MTVLDRSSSETDEALGRVGLEVVGAKLGEDELGNESPRKPLGDPAAELVGGAEVLVSEDDVGSADEVGAIVLDIELIAAVEADEVGLTDSRASAEDVDETVELTPARFSAPSRPC